MPDLDFTGLGEAAQAAFKPHFAEVVRREARRRRNIRMAGAAVAASAVAVSGAAVGLAREGRPQFAAPAFDPYRTPDFIPPPEGTPPPGEDSSHKTRSGPVVAGDLDHLYARWQHCRVKGDCELMVAATADGGATWHSYPLPVGRNAMVDLRAVGPRTLVAWAQEGDGPPTQTWHSSTDGGATWRELHPRTVDALPPGWRVLDDFDYLLRAAVTAIDPVTGDVAALAPRSLSLARAVGGLPPAAGLWVSGYLGTTLTPETDPGNHGTDQRITGTGSAVEVSTDGGRTWHRHVFPEELVAADDAPGGAAAIATDDGRTVYALGRIGGVLRIYRSPDGGQSWQRTAAHAEVGARPIRAAMGANGRLVIQAGPEGEDPVLMFESVDGGATVQQIPAGPGASATRVTGGYAQSGGPWSNGAWLSTDGTRWAFVNSPEVP